jgi:predicted ATPase
MASLVSLPRCIDRVALGEVIVDLAQLCVERSGESAPLTPREADLFAYLWRHLDRVVSREQLLHEVWMYHATSGTRAVDYAVWRLRAKLGDAEPTVHLKSVYGQGYVLTGARLCPPVPVPAPARPSNLSPPRTSWVGRASELEQLASLCGPGLVTLTGPVGVGKTRLAIEHALRSLPELPGGAWEVRLAQTTREEEVLAAVARVLRAPSATPDAIGRALALQGRTLLLLDNLEQVVEVAAPALDRWLRQAPEATVLCTSRRALGLPGERLLALQPLPPEDALALLCSRADAAGISSSTEGLPALIRRLDALPLALELVARRLRVLTPAQILHRLEEGLAVVGEAPRGTDPRHATLEQAIGWSWDLLEEGDRELLCACAIFRGGFELEALEEITGLPDVPRRLEILLEHSLLRVERGPRLVRFSLYQSVRDFARARTERSVLQALELAHARRYAAWGHQLAASIEWTDDWARTERLAAELDNLVAAFEASVQIDPVCAAEAALAAARAMITHGPQTGAEDRLTRCLAAELPEELALDLVRMRGELRLIRDALFEAEADLEQAERSSRAEHALRATYLKTMSLRRRRALDEPARRYAELVERAEAYDLSFLAVRLLVHQASATPEPEASQACLRRALALSRSIGFDNGEIMGSIGLSADLFHQGHASRAAAVLAEIVSPQAEAHGSLLNNRGHILTWMGHLEEAERVLHASVALSARRGGPHALAEARSYLADLWAFAGRLDEAEALLGPCVAHYQRTEARIQEAACVGLLGRIVQHRGEHSRVELLLERALELLPEPSSFRARAHADRAELAWAVGELDGARQRFERALELIAQNASRVRIASLSLRAAGLAALDDPERARLLLEHSRLPEEPAWMAAARDLVLGLGEASGEPEARRRAQARLMRAREACPVDPVRFLAERLEERLGR